MSKTSMVTGVGVAGYLNLWKPRDTDNGPRYSVCAMFPESDKKTKKQMETCIKAAIEVGIKKGKFKKGQVKRLKLPIRSGTEEYDGGNGDKGKEYDGKYFVNANAYPDSPPKAADKYGKRTFDEEMFYSGCLCRFDINFYPFNNSGNVGVAVAFNNIMFVKDGDRLDGRRDPEEAFGEFAEQYEENAEEGGLE